MTRSFLASAAITDDPPTHWAGTEAGRLNSDRLPHTEIPWSSVPLRTVC